jgi:two-component system, chemotaxis family, protein-glutamate methylesterase/glutaminase
MAEKSGILVVDDSAFMRKVISQIINTSPDFYVVDTAQNGRLALEKLSQYSAEIQLVTLDIQMPEMDGLACLQQIMQLHPRRVVMVSSLTTEGARETLQALEYGAIDFLAKPGGAISLQFETVGPRLLEVLRTAARSRLPVGGKLAAKPAARQVSSPPPPAASPRAAGLTGHRLIVIASSTGGPKALNSVIPQLPRNLRAAVVVVQHMPMTFTRLLAERLDKVSALKVQEAAEGTLLQDGVCYIAAGGKHLEITPSETLHLTDDPPIGGLRPCADVTLYSAAAVYGRRALGVVLTGMGRDGTDGCAALKRKGSRILVESKDTALIYGMPKSVVDAGLHDRIVDLEDMAQAIVQAADDM